MPFYMDRHDFNGVSAADVAGAHLKDLEVQAEYGVQFLNYWFDEERQTTFCLAKAADAASVETVHRVSHGMVPNHVIEVDPLAVERFMGGMVNHRPGDPYVETAFRAILFTDIEGSTGLTQQLGDARAMTLLRSHDRIVQEALVRNGGSEVKHTGDGSMASFPSVAGAIAGGVEIQQRLAEADHDAGAQVRVRIGIAAGEPVTERDDLFGATVQLAARLCAKAAPSTVLVSSAVRDLALGKGYAFGKPRRLRLKGFAEAVQAYEVEWASAPVTAT